MGDIRNKRKDIFHYYFKKSAFEINIKVIVGNTLKVIVLKIIIYQSKMEVVFISADGAR